MAQTHQRQNGQNGFDTSLLAVSVVAAGAVSALLHALLWATNVVYGSFGPILVFFATYFGLIVISFVAIGWLRRRRGAVTLMDCMVHTLLVCIGASVVRTGYDYFIVNSINPQLNVEILDGQVARLDAAIANEDSLLGRTAFGAEADAARSRRTNLLVFKTEANAQREKLARNPASFGDMMLGSLIPHMLVGLFWGFITGVIFRAPSRRAQTGAQTG